MIKTNIFVLTDNAEKIEAVCGARFMREGHLFIPLLHQEACRECSALPAKVTMIENEELAQYDTETFLDFFVYIQKKNPADLVVLVGGKGARELSVRMAARLDMNVFNDCLSMKGTQDDLELVRGVYNSGLLYKQKAEFPLAVTFHDAAAFDAHAGPRESEIASVRFEVAVRASNIVRRERLSSDEDDIASCDKLIVCGMGVGGKRQIEKIQKYAEKIGAKVAGTRPVVHSGWLPLSALIGQSGKNVSPKVCLLVGVSGATPFMVGIQGAGKILAINKNEDALVFDKADMGIVADYKDVLMRLTEMGYE